MAKLDKLCLRGVRSFGPQDGDEQELKFTSPVTLILGQNGCGKTTIIESLKYACSGEIPGDRASFINDPRISNHPTTKAQIKLRLIDLRGWKYSIIKSMQVTQKMAVQTFKSLDNTVCQTKPDGTTSDLSGRCADINDEICRILGVSKPILNNVIFCHQENSLWPLEESKKLKEKFDEIFDASRYNKCIDSIRKIHKEKASHLKVIEIEVSTFRDKMTLVQNRRQTLDEQEEKLANSKENIKLKQQQLEPIDTRLRELSNLETNLQELMKQYASKEAESKGLKQQQETLLINIKSEYQGGDEQLKLEIDSFDANKEIEKAELIKMKQQKTTLEKQQNAFSIQIENKQRRIGELEKEIKQKQETINERTEFLQKSIQHFNLNSPENLQSDNVCLDVINSMHQFVIKKQSELKDLTLQYENEEKKLDQIINSCVAKVAEAKNSKTSKEQQIKEIQVKSRDIQEQLMDLGASEERSKKIRDSITSIEIGLKNCMSNFNADQVSQELDTNRKQLHNVEYDLEGVEDEYKILQQNLSVEASIDAQQQTIAKRKSEILKLKNRHFDNFKQLFEEKTIEPGSIKKFVESCKRINADKVETCTRKINEINKKITLNETLLKTKCERLQEAKNELESKQKEITAICKQNSFENVLEQVSNKLELLQKKKGQYQSGKILYEKFIDEFEKDSPCCPVCSTNFQSKTKVVETIVNSIKSKIKNIPDLLIKVEQELTENLQLQSKIIQLKPVQSKVRELNNLITPKLEKEITDLKLNLDKFKDELKTQNCALEQPKKELKAAEEVISDAALIDQYQFDIDKANATITQLTLDLKQVPSKRTRQEIEFAIQKLKTELNSRRREIDDSQKRLQQFKEKCQSLRDEKSKLVEQQLNMQKAAQGRLQLEDQLVELTAKEKQLNKDIFDLEILLKKLEGEREDAELNKTCTKQTNSTSLKETSKLLNSCEKLYEDINKIQSKLDRITNQKIEELLSKTLEEFKVLKDKQTEVKQSIDTLASNIADFNRKMDNKSSIFRTLTDNWTLRQKRKEQQAILIELDEFKKKIGDYDQNSILREKKKFAKTYEEISKEISSTEGSKKEIELNIKELRNELNKPDYRQAASKYKKKFCEFQTQKQVIKDMVSFIHALEFCLTKFHQERMVQINKIIRQLWRSIYRGNDCDYIEIKAEENSGTAGRRQYKYRVVQMKNNVELDMRGRCSAGQKVLACLVIRMALAETFSRNCGILALDEPTTNLDRANITSLSEALARMINSRKKEKNFQLIVITHDVEFLEVLTHSVSQVGNYWKVSRNQRGHSVITKESL